MVLGAEEKTGASKEEIMAAAATKMEISQAKAEITINRAHKTEIKRTDGTISSMERHLTKMVQGKATHQEMDGRDLTTIKTIIISKIECQTTTWAILIEIGLTSNSIKGKTSSKECLCSHADFHSRR